MFGYSSLPSRIWSFGAKAPVEGADLVDEQMRLAHRYRNSLVELELERRKRVDGWLRQLSPRLVEAEAAILETETALEASREAIRKASAAARTKIRPPEAVQGVKEAREKLKVLRAERKTLRTALFDSPEWMAAEVEIDVWATGEQKLRRSKSGLYWGSYLHVEQSMNGIRSGAPPKFHRWTGDGHLAVQIQGGMLPAEAFGMADNRLRIEPLPMAGSKLGRKRTRVWFRVESTDAGDPRWAVVPAFIHREMPPDSAIKWVHLIRRRIGTQCEWRVQFVLARASGWARPDAAVHGEVGIDVGWRMRPDGSLRVAVWSGSDGREGELQLPADWLTEMRRTELIRGVRDVNLNEARGALLQRIPALALPDWFREKAATLPQWRSAARLAALALEWRGKRFDGDGESFKALEAWRQRDKHLYEFEANLRDQLQRRREDLYRVFAATMRRGYRTAHIEDLDLRDFHVLPKAEEPSPNGALRKHTRDACLSVLIRCLKESMTETVEVPAPDTTRLHEACGSLERWDQSELMHTCSKCGVEYDQDVCAARNILRGMASAAAV